MEREVSMMIEIPYEANDLQDKRREDLVAMVQRQHECWPFKEGKRRFTSKTNMAHMRAVLLNPAYGFTRPRAAASKQVAAQCSNAVSADGPIPPPPPPVLSSAPSPPPPPVLSSAPSSPPTLPPPSPPALPSLQPTAIETEDPVGTELEHGTEMDFGSCALPDSMDSSGQAAGRATGENEMAMQDVDLYVDFMHPSADLERFVYSVALEQVGALNDLTGEWQGSTMQLIERLHEKAPGIEDALEITYPDPAHPEYLRRLVSAAAGGLLHSTPDAPSIHIPADNVLTLHVRFGQMRAAATAPGAAPAPAPGAAHGQHCATASGSHASQSRTATAWLAEKAQEEPGYAAFKAGQHCIQPNAAIVASWQFAVQFCERYSQKPCPVSEPSDSCQSWSLARGPRIKKKDVQDALGVGSTWMAEAQQAVHILRQYGEGGSSPRQAVIAKCASTSEKASAQDLLGYLRMQ
ncbi:uncharacterized protein F5891DRAFT_975195 [Suillus fuscotomentosus]|uniref:Uncharacterized protein n=1 Tax=Suillus fuscotomentosus TaxID=1912939 RepID=A0AAD4EJT3_9AGAM|nr:uncharacterized protein F5891DRAFT_975195 [Suillus fuscotomentosus]KAG1907510.1 hypothetical protein F5891DRAFT_975195 [Suillus fuscotomentosus]